MKYHSYFYFVVFLCIIPDTTFARIIEDLIGTTFEYKFGGSTIEPQQRIYFTEGTIPHFQRDTVIRIPDFPNMDTASIKVTVKALSSPKVDYDSQWRTLSIKYSLFQATASSYTVDVTGMQQQQQLIQYEYTNVDPSNEKEDKNKVDNLKVKTKISGKELTTDI